MVIALTSYVALVKMTHLSLVNLPVIMPDTSWGPFCHGVNVGYVLLVTNTNYRSCFAV